MRIDSNRTGLLLRLMEGIRSVGIIPDGSRRWAARERLPLAEAYVQTFRNLRRHIELLQRRGVRHIHIYAFSIYNLKRPEEEVLACLDAGCLALRELCAEGYRIRVIGDIDALLPIHARIVQAVRDTVMENGDDGYRPQLYFYIGYSFRHSLEASCRNSANLQDFIDTLLSNTIDLVVRTGGAATLSDFLPIEARYAQLCFLPSLFNDFTPAELDEICDRYEAGLPSLKYGE